MVAIVISLASAAALGSGCGDCAGVGCDSVVTVLAPEPADPRARFRACVGDRCRSSRGMPTDVSVRLTAEEVARRRVHLTVRYGSGRRAWRAEQDVELEAFSPNGERCGPTCWSRFLRLDAGERRLVPVSHR